MIKFYTPKKFEILKLNENIQGLSLSHYNISRLESIDFLNLLDINLSFNNLIKIECLDNNLVYLNVLNLCHNKIVKIENLNMLVNLKTLNLCNNQITKIEGLDNLVNLQDLNLSYNKLTKIEGLENLVKLKTLNLSNNIINIIEGLDTLVDIEKLNIYDNKINDIDGLINCVKLKSLYLANNNINNIEALRPLVNLENLYLSDNYITNIEALGNLVELQELNVGHNRILNFDPSILGLNKLTCVYYEGNPIEYIPPYIERALDNINLKNFNNIYADNQNVHDSTIQKCIRTSVLRILNKRSKFTLDDILDDEYLDIKTKEIITEYCNDKTVHSVLKISFKELFGPVWDRIESHKDSKELKKILNIEMQDSECKCFTGRISRLVNCLSGFYDDVQLQISDKSQISNIIILIKDNLEKEEKYSVELHKTMVEKELIDRGYEKEVVDEYVSYIE